MKQYEALYIDGQLANIGNSDISLDWKSVILQGINKLKCSHSYTIKLPMTMANRKIFAGAESAEHNSYVFANGQRSVIGKRMSARYYCNGVDMLGNASAFLIGTENDKYKVVLTWGNLSVMQSVIEEDKSLPEIFGGKDQSPTMIYWERWSGSKISDALGENVVCLIYDNGVVGDVMDGYVYYLPSFKVTWLLDKIFKKYGVKYDFSRKYLNTDGEEVSQTEVLLDSLYCPMTTWNDSEYVQNQCRNTWYLTQSEQQDGHTFIYGDYPAFMSRVYWIFPVGKTAPVYGWCGAFQKMKYKIHVHVRVFIDRMACGMTEAEVVNNVKLCIVNGKGTNDASKILSLTATEVKKLPNLLIDFGAGFYEVHYEYTDEWQEVGVNDNPSGDDWKNYKTGDNVDEPFIMRQGRRVWIDGYGKCFLGHEEEFLTKYNNLKSTYASTPDLIKIDENYRNYIEIIPIITEPMPWYSFLSDNGLEKSPLYLEPNFPDMKPIDFLKGIFYLIGAYPVVVEDTLKLCLYRDLADNVTKALDWSRNVVGDYEMPSQIDFNLSDWAQRNWLWYKDDDEDDPKFSGYFDINDEYLKSEADAFTLPFQGSPTKKGMASIPIYEPGKVLNVWKQTNYTSLQEIDGYVLKELKPRICSMFSVAQTYAFIAGDGSYWSLIPSSTTTTITDVMWLTLLRDSLVFENLNFANKDSAVWARYKAFAEILKHPYVVTLNMELDEFTLGSLDMSVPIYLRQFTSYFAVMEIKRKSDGKCTVKLLKIPNTLINTSNNE